ncbi:MAG: TolC family protein [Acidobacteriaceae bacterium]|nr:TolC family protein [Acidobacteriaceae bacterium]
MKTTLSLALLGLFTVATPAASHAQVSLTSAVDLALRSDPKVQSAQADVDRSKAALAESRDAFIPVVGATAGVGKSTGVPLTVPTVFTITAQSLVYNWSQRNYIRSAHLGWSSAQFALDQARDDAAEDTITTYMGLDNAIQRKAVAQQALDHAQHLLQIVSARVDAGQDPHIELPRTHRTMVNIQLQMLSIDSDIATLSEHLNHLTGLAGAVPATSSASIPALPPVASILPSSTDVPASSPSLRAAFANAEAKAEQARGDESYLYRPQISFGASYSRITTSFSNYATYYSDFANPNLSHNALSLGVQISIPVLDYAHRAKARESAAEARHAHFDAINAQNTFEEGRLKLAKSASVLELQTEAAQDDADEAKDSLEAVLIQLQPTAGNQPANTAILTPKDEQNARLNIALKQIDLLKARQQLLQTEIMLMRQTGQLANWLHSAPTAP